jgi:hypothetical protein
MDPVGLHPPLIELKNTYERFHPENSGIISDFLTVLDFDSNLGLLYSTASKFISE